MKMKKLMITGLALMIILAVAACGRQPVKTPEDEPGDIVIVDPNPQGETVEITLYYMNRDYIVTGNENLDKVIPVTREVVIGEKSVDEVILMELQREPQEDNIVTSMEKIRVLGVETAGNTAYVNLSSEGLSGGSLQETSLLTQLILSLTELPEIDQVQIYVDGRVVESLMGHITITEPISREDIGY